MSLAPQQFANLSPSSRRALGYAAAAAAHRGGEPEPTVGPDDLLVGVLLSHPDRDGEGSALLSHFGLTARDLLPGDYPQLEPEDLRRHTTGIDLEQPPRLSTEADHVLVSVAEGTEEVHLRHLLGGLIQTTSPLNDRLSQRLAASGTVLGDLVQVYRSWLEDPATHARSATPAGRQLAERLTSALPRRPVDVPSYAPDRAGSGEDLVGIGREVDAFAYLIASKAQRPPLAVGLFGDWGSGKSFFMNAVKARITAIEAQIVNRSQAEVPFWKHVRQIEFNAWEYVRGTLWASLLDHIFRELEGQHIDLVRTRQEQLSRAEGDAAGRAQAEAGKRKRLKEALSDRRTELERAEEKRSEGVEQLRTARAQAIAAELGAARREIWGRHAAELAGKDAAELAAALAEARAEVVRGRGLLGPYWTGGRILVATLVALTVPGVALAADALALPTVVSLLGGLAALVPAATALLRSGTAWTRERLDRLDAVARKLDAEAAEQERELDAEVERARAAFERTEAELAAAASAEAAALAEAKGLRSELDGLTPGRVLGEFLQERSRSDDYRSHLGLLAKVREDLGQLEQLVRKNNDAGGEPEKGAPPNRIVLYIDDLDRCSSEKVVEVLEAVHLLLAFELFVVVVAVDSRWLSFALTDELRALDSETVDGRRATPQDYLEKIFQLPFWVQPLLPEGRRALVHGLLEGAVRPADGASANGAAPHQRLVIGPREQELLATMFSRRGTDPRLEAHVLALTPDDLRFMESLAPLLGDTPRRVKRFVNVTQLLLALPPSLDGDDRSPPDRAVVAFLAAVNSGLSALAPKLFAAIEADPQRPLLPVVQGLTSGPQDERDVLTAWLQQRPEWRDLQLGRLETRLDVVRRLSFHRERRSAGG